MKKFLTIKEVAKLLNKDVQCIRRFVRNGDIVAVKKGNKYLIKSNFIMILVQQNEDNLAKISKKLDEDTRVFWRRQKLVVITGIAIVLSLIYNAHCNFLAAKMKSIAPKNVKIVLGNKSGTEKTYQKIGE